MEEKSPNIYMWKIIDAHYQSNLSGLVEVEGRLYNVCKKDGEQMASWEEKGDKALGFVWGGVCYSLFGLKWRRPQHEHGGRGGDVDILDLYVSQIEVCFISNF